MNIVIEKRKIGKKVYRTMILAKPKKMDILTDEIIKSIGTLYYISLLDKAQTKYLLDKLERFCDNNLRLTYAIK